MVRRTKKAQPHARRSRLALASRLTVACAMAALVIMSAAARSGDQAANAAALVREGRFDVAKERARAALAAAPLDARAVKVLAWLAEADSSPNEAAQLMNLAGRLGRRDTDVQGWLLRWDLSGSRYAAGYSHADAMMRSDRGRPEVVYPQLINAAKDAQGQAVLAAYLVQRPPWRQAFLNFLGQSADPQLSAGVMQRLADMRSPPTAEELGPFIGRLIAEEGHAKAYAFWRGLAGAKTPDAAIFDGGFDGRAAPLPFDWYFGSSKAGYAAEEADPDGSDGKSLHVAYDGFSPGTFATQMLDLQPGSYVLKLRIRGPSTGVRDRLRWRVWCLGGEPYTSFLPQPSQEWVSVEHRFQVGGGGCPSGVISIEGVPGGRRRPIDVWFDDVELSRVGP